MDQLRPSKPLSPVQRRAAVALASGEQPDHVANDARVTRRTLYRWMRRPEFRRVMDGAGNSFHESCRPETAAARLQAFRTLVDMAIYCKPDERVRAANSLLAYLDRHETSPERRQKWRRPKKSRT